MVTYHQNLEDGPPPIGSKQCELHLVLQELNSTISRLAIFIYLFLNLGCLFCHWACLKPAGVSVGDRTEARRRGGQMPINSPGEVGTGKLILKQNKDPKPCR